MVKEYLIDVVLIVHENTHEIDKHCVQANLDGKDVVMKYLEHLYYKTS